MSPKYPWGVEPIAFSRKTVAAGRKNYKMTISRTTLNVEMKKSP
jgi:hypothetical protein